MKNKTELKSCPFCGGKAIISDGFTPRINGTAYMVICAVCHTMSNLYGTKRAAIKHWGRRADNG